MSSGSSLFKNLESSDGKTYATGLVRPKTTALLFDKIWYPSDLPEYDNIPASIKYTEKTPSQVNTKAEKYMYEVRRDLLEQRLSQDESLLEDYYRSPSDVDKNENSELVNQAAVYKKDSFREKVLRELNRQYYEKAFKIIEESFLSKESLDNPIGLLPIITPNLSCPIEYDNFYKSFDSPKDGYYTSYFRNTGIRAATIRLRIIDHINIVPVYFDYTDYEEFLLFNGISRFLISEETEREALKKKSTKQESSFDMIEACIDSVPIIVEEKLTWSQVEEIRKDKASINKLSRFWRWANTDFTGKSRSEISDILNKELDDYQFALRKHGISTTIGGFTTLLSGAATFASAISNTPVNLTSACLSITAGLLSFSTKAATDLLECNRNPIAYIYDVIKRTNGD